MCPKSFDNPQLGKGYLIDLVAIFKEEGFRSINRYKDSKNNDYELGSAVVYSRVISLMIRQSKVYNIPLAALSLDDINPDKDLLPGS